VAQGATSGFGLSGSASTEGSTFTVTANSTSANTVSTIVFRDGSGNFSAGTITAALTGNVTGTATTATNVAGGTANQIPYQTAAGVTSFITAPSVSTTYLQWTGSAFTWASVAAGGVTSVSAGTDTAVSTTTGAVTVWNNSTLQTITSRGATTDQAISITNTTAATATNTGALQVVGGVGIGGNLYVGGTVFGVATTATNIAGGSQGSIPYQTAAGATAFIPIGTDKFVLQSNGTTATWVSTSSLGISGGSGSAFNGGTITTALIINSSTQATSTDSGALQVINGGAGIGGNLYVGGVVVGGGVRTTSSTTAPTNPTVGDIWYETANDVVYRYTNDGTTSYWIDITGPTLAAAVSQYATLTGVETLTNKRVTLRVSNNGATTSGTITPAGDSSDQYEVLGLTGGITLAAPSGTPTAGQKLLLRIKDNGTTRTIAWTTSSGAYRAIGVTLTTATTANKNIYVGCVYNSTDVFWDVVALSQEA